MGRVWCVTRRLATFAILLAAVPATDAIGQNTTENRKPQTGSTQTHPFTPWRTTWGGAELTGTDWSVYSGTTSVLFGDDIRKSGWRIRSVTGYGRYSYVGSRHVNTADQQTQFDGHHGFGDLLIGYQQQIDNWTVKGFAGITSAGHTVTPFDPDNAAIGYAFGVTGALEVWLNLTEETWLSVDAKYATLFDSFNATSRFGYRLWPSLSLGLEVGTIGNIDYAAGRAAAFGVYDWSMGQIRLSAGISADRDRQTSPHASLNLVFHY